MCKEETRKTTATAKVRRIHIHAVAFLTYYLTAWSGEEEKKEDQKRARFLKYVEDGTIDPNDTTLPEGTDASTITFCDVAENCLAMQQIGEKMEAGFSTDDVQAMFEHIKATQPDLKPELHELDSQAKVLVVRGPFSSVDYESLKQKTTTH